MIGKVAFAAAIAVAPVAASISLPDDAIPKVMCPMPGGYASGTAFRIGNGLLLSVRHVTDNPGCMIDGKPITVEYADPKRDFSIIRVPGSGAFLKVDCGGFIAGRRYRALGHARGVEEVISVDLVADGETRGQFSILHGMFTVIPGQSGGPIVDAETGAVVGLVNVYDYRSGMSGSVALKDTSVCSVSDPR